MAGKSADPARIGILVDATGPDGKIDPNILPVFEMVAETYAKQGILDRPVEFVTRVVRGLPNGSFRAVRDAYHELVDADCMAVFGPCITENGVPLAPFVEAAKVPCLTMAGTEDMLGEYVFALNNGSMADEGMVLANVVFNDGHRNVIVSMDEGRSDVGITHVNSFIGQQYLQFGRVAWKEVGLNMLAEVAMPLDPAARKAKLVELRKLDPDAIIHLGQSAGLFAIGDVTKELGWDIPRYTQTAFESGARADHFRQQLAGWIGLDQYDERNKTGQEFLDAFEARTGRRPEYYWPLYIYDVARVLLRAVGGAHPLTGEGAKNALEKVKMLPAACGAPGTRIRFGKYIRQGWVGSEYLVARRMLDDGSGSVMHATMEGRV